MSKYHCKMITPDWDGECLLCDCSPIVPRTGMCGPCTWGEAETLAGNCEDVVDERCGDCDGTCPAMTKSD